MRRRPRVRAKYRPRLPAGGGDTNLVVFCKDQTVDLMVAEATGGALSLKVGGGLKVGVGLKVGGGLKVGAA